MSGSIGLRIGLHYVVDSHGKYGVAGPFNRHGVPLDVVLEKCVPNGRPPPVSKMGVRISD
jgi:hypothetical protein